MLGGAFPLKTNQLNRPGVPMRYPFLLALVLPSVVAGQSSQRGRGSPGTFFAGVSNAPQAIVASNVPVLEGLPHAVKIGLTVYVSAMLPLGSIGRVVGAGDLRAEARQAIGNLGAVMRAARGVPGDVVRATVYVRDLTPDKVAIVREAVLDGLDRAAPPALTVIGVSALAVPGADVAIEATAQLRGEFPDRSRDRKP
jgi:enamine deaminase RidA (YjgF/YER057c/UK114 family)